jgi:hypothetical protein
MTGGQSFSNASGDGKNVGAFALNLGPDPFRSPRRVPSALDANSCRRRFWIASSGVERTTASLRDAVWGRAPRLSGRDWSVAEEQPQQNDHRNRHTKQPEQESASHCSLLSCGRVR